MFTLGFIWYATGGPSRPEAWQGPFIEPPVPIGTGEIYRAGQSGSPRALPSSPSRSTNGSAQPLVARSKWYGQVSINSGSGPYEIQPNQEYIVLEANYDNIAPITVTGWSVTNGKNQPDGVVIPRGIHLFIGNSVNPVTVPITLIPGARLILTTGRMPNSDPYTINVNFLTNKCTGYLGALPQYRFTPALRRSCPNPAKDPEVRNLDKKCYDFVSRLPACHTPKIKRDSDGNEFIDGVLGLSSQCRAFLENHFNYNRCVGWHEGDPDFYGDEWRVFLNRSWELWAENREHITLYDQFGKIVTERDY